MKEDKKQIMANFKYQGFTYEIITRVWKKGNTRYECIKWKTGLRNFWERISYDDYLKVKSKAIKT